MLAPNHPLQGIPASFPIGKRWYCFYSHINTEKKARDAIHDLGFPVFVPFEKRIQRHRRGRPRHYEMALFPRYGFVQFEINDDAWGSILSADGVVDVLRMNYVPVSVPTAAIDGLRLADSVGVFDRTKPPTLGMSVELSEGPFAGWIGKVVKARTGDRMDVLLQIFGAERLVTASLGSLRET